LDPHGKLPGRGAYICPQRSCAEHVIKGARLREAFRHEVTLYPIDELVRAMARVMEEKALACIRIARKAGRVVSGYTQVSRALMYEPVACLLIAEDVARERLREYQGRCAIRQIPCRSFLTKARLGELAGRDESSAIGILDRRLSERLMFYLEGMGRLMER
jgi:ribosomal protein L7Ae-like RNA K-turn-binding protein